MGRNWVSVITVLVLVSSSFNGALILVLSIIVALISTVIRRTADDNHVNLMPKNAADDEYFLMRLGCSMSLRTGSIVAIYVINNYVPTPPK